MTLKSQFFELIRKGITRGGDLSSRIKYVTTEEDLTILGNEYDDWVNSIGDLLSNGLSISYRHYSTEFIALNGLGNVNAGMLENKLTKIRNSLEKKVEYMKWFLEKGNTIPDQAFNIIPNKQHLNSVIKNNTKKIFISHASKDKEFVSEIIDLLRGVGLKQAEIFCTSFEGYGIDLGENFLDRIKDELGNEVLVLFVLTKNFYASEVCLCEMGATWVNAKRCIPLLIPPFAYSDIKGVFPQTQGLHVTEPYKLNSLKTFLEKEFSLAPIDLSEWDRLKGKFLKNVELLISKYQSPTI